MLNIADYNGAERVFRFFEEICAIPHGSGNTGMIADYLVNFARERGLEYIKDKADNVIIRKPATKGYEDRPAVIFQGHLDMVAEKTPGSDIDMTREGLTLYRDGDFIRAKDTTLGGDDGVALAYALAVLDDDSIQHPDFEALFTSDEEIGLLGAVALDPENIKGRLLINIDSDNEGIFTAGCAGGVRSDLSMPVKYEKCNLPKAYKVRLHGFKGGHSGVEIDKGRANAIKVLSELLNCIFDIRIASITGGNADNAIVRECEAVICAGEDFPENLSLMLEKRKNMLAVMPDVSLDELKEMMKDCEGKRLYEVEPDVELDICEVALPELALDEESTEKLISMLVILPSGVIAMSKTLAGLVETSLNLGILRLGANSADVSFSVRSAVGDEKKNLCSQLRKIAESYGAEYGERGDYPAWEYKQVSHLREVMKNVYRDMYEEEPKVVIIHAGLECGILSEKIAGLDCVSIGPDNFDIHTTEEHLSISSTVRVWEFLKRVLKEI